MVSVPAAFNVMVKPVGALCNLACRYCYYLSKENLYSDSSMRMEAGMLEEFTRQYILAQKVPSVQFIWQGGEPLLAGLDFYEQAISFQKKFGRSGQHISNSIQTNAILIDEAWCEFFKEHGFLVGVSLDGPEELHDRYRVDGKGRGSFSRVMAGIGLLQQYGIEYNILTSVHAANAGHPLDVYRFLREDVGAEYIQFIPIVERRNETGYQEGFSVTRRSVSGKKYGSFLMSVFDEWYQHDVGRVYVQIFDTALAAWVGQLAGVCVFSETCGTAVVLEHNGDLYACDHFVEPRWLLGNLGSRSLVSMVTDEKQVRFGADKRDSLPQYCRDCDVRFVCQGGCPKNRIRRTPAGEEGLNILCEGYRMFFQHVSEPMERMAAVLRGRLP